MSKQAQPSREVLQRILLGFEGTRLPAELRELLEQGLAGVIVYRRNYTNLEELLALTAEIRAAAGRPVLIGMDQEGGTKFSLPEPFTQWPSPEELGLLDDASLTEQLATAMGRELRAAGANLDFAPMLDLHLNPASPVTTHRSFGADPAKVSKLGTAVVRGLSRAGVLACAKHFPGHGDVQVDPHDDMPVFMEDERRLMNTELVPFAAAIAAGVPAIMSAHILLPRVDQVQPASLSRKLLYAVLRRKLRFDGLILADDLGMGAIRKRIGVSEAAVETIRAGTDLVMLCHDWSLVRPCLSTVQKAYDVGMIEPAEWDESLKRIARVTASAGEGPAPARDVIGCAEHRALAQEAKARVAQARAQVG